MEETRRIYKPYDYMEETLALQIWIDGSLMFLDFSFHSERQAKSKARPRPLDTCWQHHVPTIAGEQQSKDCKDRPNPAVSLETRWAPRRWHSQHLPTIMGPRNFKVLTSSHWASPHITSPCIIWVCYPKKKNVYYTWAILQKAPHSATKWTQWTKWSCAGLLVPVPSDLSGFI